MEAFKPGKTPQTRPDGYSWIVGSIPANPDFACGIPFDLQSKRFDWLRSVAENVSVT